MQFKRNKRIETSPDITPMIDVVFLLLIFFMLSTTFIVSPGIKISLPKSASEKVTKEKEEIKVIITDKGEIYMGKEKVDIDALKVIFLNAARDGAESIAVISADKNALHGKVVEIMDMAKKSGISKLAIETAPE